MSLRTRVVTVYYTPVERYHGGALRPWKTAGLGGPKHVDLYIGDETGPDFTAGDLYTTLVNAELRI